VDGGFSMSEERRDEQKKAEEVKDPEAEYDRAWQEMEEGSEKKAEEKGSEDAVKGSEDEEGSQKVDVPPEGAGGEDTERKAEKTEKKTEKKTEERDEERLGSIEKALRDTKAWATRLAQENAELKRTLEAYEKGLATRQDVEDAKKAVKDAQDNLDEIKSRVYEDYPELKDLLDPVLDMTRSLKEEIDSIRAEQRVKAENDERQRALEEFNLRVKPKVKEVHPDFEEIIFQKGPDGQMVLNDEYFQWAAEQSPALRFAATESSDPQDIIWAVREFKKWKATPEADEYRQRQQMNRERKLETAQSIMPSSGPAMPISKTGDASEDDYDKAWAEATKRLEKT